MRIYPKILLLAGFAALQMLQAAPSVSAADLAMKSHKRVAVRAIHHKRVARHYRNPAVRDYDGTSIVVRRRPVMVRGYDGAIVISAEYEAVPARRASPSRYLNGQPVLPYYPKSWPRPFRAEL
jgi:hypothetical protein